MLSILNFKITFNDEKQMFENAVRAIENLTKKRNLNQNKTSGFSQPPATQHSHQKNDGNILENVGKMMEKVSTMAAEHLSLNSSTETDPILAYIVKNKLTIFLRSVAHGNGKFYSITNLIFSTRFFEAPVL